MKIAIGADHRGFSLKKAISRYLTKSGYKVIDYGVHSEESIDYPNIALPLAKDVARKRVNFGILICFTGQGMAMTANKVKGIRAAVCVSGEVARYARAHNNANICVVPGMISYGKKVRDIVNTFMQTKFDGGRHLRRVNIIEQYERVHLRVPE